jgi:hypothetical protein
MEALGLLRVAAERGKRHGTNARMEVDTVPERPPAGPVPLDVGEGAATGPGAVAFIATGARVRRADQEQARGKRHRVRCPRAVVLAA